MQQLESIRDVDNDRVKPEIEALLVIYEEDGVEFDEVLHTLTVDFSLPSWGAIANETEVLSKVRISITIPATYPSQPPSCSISSDFISCEEAQRICTEALEETFIANNEVLYNIIESIREKLDRDHTAMCEAKRECTPMPERCRVIEASNDPSNDSESSVWPPDESDAEYWSSYESYKKPKRELHVTSEAVCSQIPISSSGPLVDRQSVFQAHVATVTSYKEVCEVRDRLMLNNKISRATHNIMAYRLRLNFHMECEPTVPSDVAELKGKKKEVNKLKKKQTVIPCQASFAQDHDSDGEFGAGTKLQHLLSILAVENVVVIVTRWYGGIHLGPDRFKHINNIARQALEQFGYIDDNVKGRRGKT